MDYLPVDLRSGLKKIQNTVLQRSPVEIKVREATSNDPWGASTTLKAEIAQATRNFEDYKVVMSTIWTRLQDSGKNFRHVLKGLQLLEYLIGSGSERVIDECKESIYTIRTLRNFQYIDEKGKDQGNAVREAAKALIKLLGDEKAISESRQTAKKMKKNMVGISSAESGFSRGGRGGSSYDDDDERESKYDNYSSKAPKAAPRDEDDEEEQPKPQKKASRQAPVFDDDEEEQQQPEGGFNVRKTAPAASKMRPPSPDPQPQPVRQQQPAKPKQQTVGELLSIDSFMTPDPFASAAPQQTFNPRPVQQQSWETNEQSQEGFGDDSFSSSFDADFQPAQTAPEKQQDSIMDLAAGLVNLDLKEKTSAVSTQPQPGQQPAQAKSILERQKEKGTRLPPPKLAPAPTAVGAVPGAPGARPTGMPGAYPPQQPYPGTYSPQQTPGYPPQPYPGARPPQPYGAPGGAYPPQPGAYPPNAYGNPFGAAPPGARPGYPYQ